ncbi:MAG TPA: lysophospholipid acyltransferase family protein [Candidatus Hydrogenedentes bacterium]|jgi:1-acyl-sn-glycerol-3-phosphate acyltransferase|nr:lysophospholipid acyltransferase family protein [Candidatus Hydrogenedentota bacterium]
MNSLWGSIRAGWRVPTLVVWTSIMLGLCLLCRCLAKLRSREAELRVRSGFVRTWARISMRLAGFRIHLVGPPPPRHAFTVSNHLSSIDSVLIAAVTGGVFVARHDMAQWPGIGFLTRHMDIIFVNRSRRTEVGGINEQIASALHDGFAVHVFAESRIGDGKTVQAFKPALLEAAVRADIPVHYAILDYRTRPGDPPPSQAVHWGPGVSFIEHILGILRLKGGEAFVTFGDEPVAGTDRKVLANALWEKVNSRFIPLE